MISIEDDAFRQRENLLKVIFTSVCKAEKQAINLLFFQCTEASTFWQKFTSWWLLRFKQCDMVTIEEDWSEIKSINGKIETIVCPISLSNEWEGKGALTVFGFLSLASWMRVLRENRRSENKRIEKHSCYNVTNFVKIRMMFFRNRRQTTQSICLTRFLIFFSTPSFFNSFFDTIIALLGHPFHKEMLAYSTYHVLYVIRLIHQELNQMQSSLLMLFSTQELISLIWIASCTFYTWTVRVK